MSTNPFAVAAVDLGARAVYVMADAEGLNVPDTSGNGRAALALTSSVDLVTSSALPAFDRVAWFPGTTAARGQVLWASWMDMGQSFTWVVVARGGYTNESNQTTRANIASNGNERWQLRHENNSSRISGWTLNQSPQGGYASAWAILGSSDYQPRGWHTFGVRSVSATVEAWVDGQKKRESSGPASYGVGGQERLSVGARRHSGSWDRPWRGHIAAIAAFPTALTTSQMEQLHAATLLEPGTIIAPDAHWRLWRDGSYRAAILVDPNWTEPPPPPDPPPDPEDPPDYTQPPPGSGHPRGGPVYVSNMQLSASGGRLYVSYDLWAENNVTMSAVTVAVRTVPGGNNLDFGQAANVSLAGSTEPVTRNADRALSSGTYDVWFAYQLSGSSTWYNPDPRIRWTQP